jgi:hypothetical protein
MFYKVSESLTPFFIFLELVIGVDHEVDQIYLGLCQLGSFQPNYLSLSNFGIATRNNTIVVQKARVYSQERN